MTAPNFYYSPQAPTLFSSLYLSGDLPADPVTKLNLALFSQSCTYKGHKQLITIVVILHKFYLKKTLFLPCI